MDQLDEIVITPAPLRNDEETRRWYSDGGTACVALTARHLLLEPLPTFGARCYRLIGTQASLRVASEWAAGHDFLHARVLPPTVRRRDGSSDERRRSAAARQRVARGRGSRAV